MNKKQYWVVGLVVLVLALYFIANKLQSNQPVTEATNYGTLFVSMAKETPEGFVDVVSAYTYVPGVSNGTFAPLLDFGPIPTLQTEYINTEGDMFFAYAPGAPSLLVNPNEEQATSSAEDTDKQIVNENSLRQLMTGATNIGFTNFSEGGLTNILSNDNLLIAERYLDWSAEAGLLAFAAQDAAPIEVTDTTDDSATVSTENNTTSVRTEAVGSSEQVDRSFPWNVYIVDPETQKVIKVATGFAPQWSPDGTSLVFMAPDGLYQYDNTTQEVTQVVSAYEDAAGLGVLHIDQNMNMDLTADGSMLVVSSPNQHALLFFDVLSWSPFSIRIAQAVPHRLDSGFQYYWPTFSPDGTMLAVQVTDSVKSDVSEEDSFPTDISTSTDIQEIADVLAEENPRIEIYNLLSGETLETISLDGYDFTNAFIDDWSY